MPDEPSYAPALDAPQQLESGYTPATFQHSFRLFTAEQKLAEQRGWRAAAVALTPVVLLTMLGFWIEPIIRGTNLAILYMLAVVITALRWGRWAAVISAVSGALLFDYFFVPPFRTFAVTDVWYLITLLGLLSIGLIVSMLTLAARGEAQASRTREKQTAALYSLAKSLAGEEDLDQRLDTIERNLFQTFQRPIMIWLPDEKGLSLRACTPGLTQNDVEHQPANWVFENGQAAGSGTGRYPDSPYYYVPLKTWKGVVGVLGIQAGSSTEWLPGQQRRLLETFANQAALAIKGAMLARESQRIAVLQEADKLQKALLNSISHNLRTPLASVTGALNTLLEDSSLLDASMQRELLKTAQEEAGRLDRLMQNLLDMTRLEGGAVKVRREPHDVQDAVGAALEQLTPLTRGRLVTVNIPPEFPLVPMDFVLIVQVLVNLLDNALKYSPPEAPIEVGAKLHQDQLEIWVADSGKGIPEQYLERVFEKFFRVAAPEGPGGAGLGLSICKGLIEAHQGRIWAHLRPHGGTKMTFSLPLGSQP